MKTVADNGSLANDLVLLASLEQSICVEFCRIAAEFCFHGVNEKRIASAANKLGVDKFDLLATIRGLMFILSEAVKIRATPEGFPDATSGLPIPESLREPLRAQYAASFVDLEASALKSADLKVLPSFHDFQWRLNAQVASRSVKLTSIPSVMVNIVTKSCDNNSDNADKAGSLSDSLSGALKTPSSSTTRDNLLELDIPSLKYLSDQLELALSEMRSREFRKLTHSLR